MMDIRCSKKERWTKDDRRGTGASVVLAKRSSLVHRKRQVFLS